MVAVFQDSLFPLMGNNDNNELYDDKGCTDIGNDPPHATWKELVERIKES